RKIVRNPLAAQFERNKYAGCTRWPTGQSRGLIAIVFERSKNPRETRRPVGRSRELIGIIRGLRGESIPKVANDKISKIDLLFFPIQLVRQTSDKSPQVCFVQK